jgi:hypothetical protein
MSRQIGISPGLHVSELAHCDCWGWCGDRTVSRPEPNSTPEAAMELLLEKARLVFGEQDWSTWEWSAREYGTSTRSASRWRATSRSRSSTWRRISFGAAPLCS